MPKIPFIVHINRRPKIEFPIFLDNNLMNIFEQYGKTPDIRSRCHNVRPKKMISQLYVTICRGIKMFRSVLPEKWS